MVWRKMVVLAALAVALAACTRYPPEIYGFEFENAYVLDSNDEVRVVVYEVDNLPQVYKVDASGYISMPMAGVVQARGKTVLQLQQTIAARLKDRYIKDPKVAICPGTRNVIDLRVTASETISVGGMPVVRTSPICSMEGAAPSMWPRSTTAECKTMRSMPASTDSG